MTDVKKADRVPTIQQRSAIFGLGRKNGNLLTFQTHTSIRMFTQQGTQKFAMLSCYRTLHSPIRTFPHSPQLKLLFRTALRSEKLNCTLHSTEFLAPLASSPHRKNVNYGQQVACADLKMHKCYAIKNWQSAKCHWPKTSFKISFLKISTLKNRNKKLS